MSEREIRDVEAAKANIGLFNLCALAGALRCNLYDLLGPAAAESESRPDSTT